MNKNQRFRIANANIVAEIFGDEVVIVNLDSGIYYSLRNSAAQIWIRVQNFYSLPEILDELILLYEADAEEMEESLNKFMNELMTHNLITLAEGEVPIPVDFDKNKSKTEFVFPVIEIFSDMQDILLLDPVHDVDQAGWPITKDQKNSEVN